MAVKGITRKATVVEDFDPAQKVGFADLVAVFNCSSRQINVWIDGGYLTKDKQGMFKLCEAVAGAQRYLRDHGVKRGGQTKDASTTRVNEARARAIEQDTALKSKELISFSEHCAIVDILLGGISAELDGLPAQLTRDKTLRAGYDAKLTEMKKRLQERWERMARSSEEDADIEPDAGEEEA